MKPSRARRRAAASATAIASLSSTAPAWACPVCGQGAAGSEGAYLFMSGVLSALPLLIVAGIVAWVVAHARAAAREPPARPALREVESPAPRERRDG